MKKIYSYYRRFRRFLSRCRHAPAAERFSEIDLIYDLLVPRVKHRPVMVDVGAQFGESFLPFLDRGWRVLAFEPDPNPEKRSALMRKSGPLLTVSDIAVSDAESDQAEFFTSSESTGISTLAAFHETHRATARVRVSTLRRELQAASIDRVDFLKIDTEGFDFPVLKGYPWEREAVRPKVILCEFEDAKTIPLGYTWREMAQYLSAKGFTVLVSEWHPILRYGVAHKWRNLYRFPCALTDSGGWGNLIAFSDPSYVSEFESFAQKFRI